MPARLFSDAGLRWADQDHGRWEPPAHPDALRDEAIADAEARIWADADWLDTACNHDQVAVSLRLCERLIRVKARIHGQMPQFDTPEQSCLRELIACMDKEVRREAERHIDEGDY